MTRLPSAAYSAVAAYRSGARLLLCALVLLVGVAPSARSQPSPASDCLLPLARVWGTLKYFHPALATPSVRWDSVGVAAIEALGDQCTSAAVSRALAQLFEPLNDPVTRVITDSEASIVGVRPAVSGASNVSPSPWVRWSDDSVLVLTINRLTNVDSAVTAMGQHRALLARARRVVIDVRGTTAGQSAALSTSFTSSRVDRALLTHALCAAAPRRRVHAGLPGGDAPPEFIGWREPQRPCIAAESDVPKQSVVFLADSLSALPELAPAMRAAGRALIVGVGPVTDASLIATDTVVVVPGVSVQLRLSAFAPCGGGQLADTTVTGTGTNSSANANDRASDLPLRIALSFAMRAPVVPHCDALPVVSGRFAPRDSLLPSRAWRLLAAFEIYSAVRFFDPHLTLVDGQDWERIVSAELNVLANAGTRRVYIAAISRLGAALNDGHALFPPNRLLSLFGAAFPPVVVARVEGEFVVSEVLDSAAAGGLRRGDIISTLDGQPISARFDSVHAVVPGSNAAARNASSTTFTMAGADSSRLVVGVRTTNGRDRTVTLQRRPTFLGPTFNPARGTAMRTLTGNVGYADLRLLTPSQVDSMFARFRDARALILDLRGYPQGTHPFIARRLTDRRMVASRIRQPVIESPSQNTARLIVPGISQTTAPFTEFAQYVEPDGRPPFAGRVYVLIDERAMSQAEQAALFYRTVGKATLVGSNTAGANGDVTTFTVPGRVGFGFTGMVALSADGIGMQGAGLAPDVRVTPTVRGIRAGRDEVLECAQRLATGVARGCGAGGKP